jgi:hypothetical protein
MKFVRRLLQFLFPNKEWNYEADVEIALKAFSAAVTNLEKAGARMDKERAALEAKIARIKARDEALDETLAKVSTIKGRLGWLLGDIEDSTADDAG